MPKPHLHLIFALALLSSCSLKTKVKSVEHESLFVTGSANNKLEVLDWGGKGTAILFLSGLGNTAHVFDEFAPRFADRFHVYALTRRGFGKSEASASYDYTALTADILAVIDSLHLNKVILAGHSIAGEEVSKFASLHPGRVEKIVYLDAAIDRTSLGSMFSIAPMPPKASKVDSVSIESMEKYEKSKTGISVPAEEIR